MRLVKPSWEIWEQGLGLEGIYKIIERAGRVCYRSEDKIKEDSAKKFVNHLMSLGHNSVLEHASIYLKVPWEEFSKYLDPIGPKEKTIFDHDYVKYVIDDDWVYISSNYRWLVENKLQDWIQYNGDPIEEYHTLRYVVKFTSNIHFYKDITRHRKMSFSIESTRYCNYSLGKFDNQVTFLMPVWINLEEGRYGVGHDFVKSHFIHHLDSDTRIFPVTDEELGIFNFIHGLIVDEAKYLRAIKYRWRPEQAAELLPQATKADIVVSGFIDDWKYIFDVRADGITGVPHPEVLRLMKPLKEEFVKRQWLK